MSTLIELIAPTDTITLYADPSNNGWVYNNSTLDAWYAKPSGDPKVAKRPNAHGAYGLGQVFVKEHRPIVNGQYYGSSPLDALNARNRINALQNDGNSITMRVTDELGVTTREVWVIEASPTFHYDFSHVPFDISMIAPDPRRYGGALSDSDGMPSAGSGLVWNLGTAVSGKYFDWGTAGVAGQVDFTNTGDATTYPIITVGGAGAFAVGFRITEVETGRELTFVRATNTGETIIFDSRTQRAYLADGDVTGSLSSRDWFEIPAGAHRRYQVNPLGAVSGSPTITVTASPAYM